MYKIMLLIRGPKDQQSALWSYYFITQPIEGDESGKTEIVEYSSDSIEDVQNTVEELLNQYAVYQIRVVNDMTISLNIVVS